MMKEFQKILIGYDGSAGAKAALRYAMELATDSNATLTALWVRESLPRYSDMLSEVLSEKESSNEHFQRLAREIAATAREHCLNIHFVSRPGNPVKMIVQYADECSFDLIVLGHSGHSDLWVRLLGDTANRIVDKAECRVLIV